ncbi:MAG: TRAP transporter small permease [Devosia sp.]
MATVAGLWKRFTESVAVVAFAVMFAAFVVQVASRYIFNAPIAWTLEVCLIAYVWVVFWSSELLVRERQHIIFDVLYNMAPLRQRRWLAVAITASLLIVFAVALPGTWDYVTFVARRRTTILHLPMPWVFGAFLVFLITAIASSAIRLAKLLRSGWQDDV